MKSYSPHNGPTRRSLHIECLIRAYDAALADGLDVGHYSPAVCDHCSAALGEAHDHAVLMHPEHYGYESARARLRALEPDPARRRVVCSRYQCRRTARLYTLDTRTPYCGECGSEVVRRRVR